MHTAATVAVALIAALHVYIMVLEMFMWTGPKGQKTFGLTPEFAQATRVMGANQGLYNGFLAAGLIWSLVPSIHSHALQVFFLGCVVVAGVFGALTASRKILFVQALPGAISLALVLLAGAST